MIRNVIFDFVGVIADLDFKKIYNDLSFKDKISALRLFVYYKSSHYAQDVFDAYMTGNMSTSMLEYAAKTKNPRYGEILSKLLKDVEKNLIVNKRMLDLIKEIRSDGTKVYLMSNSTPETERVMEEYGVRDYFDGVILSTETGLLKPEEDIFKYAINQYGLKPHETFFVDDNLKNVFAAEDLGFKTIDCTDAEDAFHNVGHMFYSDYDRIL